MAPYPVYDQALFAMSLNVVFWSGVFRLAHARSGPPPALTQVKMSRSEIFGWYEDSHPHMSPDKKLLDTRVDWIYQCLRSTRAANSVQNTNTLYLSPECPRVSYGVAQYYPLAPRARDDVVHGRLLPPLTLASSPEPFPAVSPASSCITVINRRVHLPHVNDELVARIQTAVDGSGSSSPQFIRVASHIMGCVCLHCAKATNDITPGPSMPSQIDQLVDSLQGAPSIAAPEAAQPSANTRQDFITSRLQTLDNADRASNESDMPIQRLPRAAAALSIARITNEISDSSLSIEEEQLPFLGGLARYRVRISGDNESLPS